MPSLADRRRFLLCVYLRECYVLNPVYTMQHVVKRVVKPVVFDNRSYRVNGVLTSIRAVVCTVRAAAGRDHGCRSRGRRARRHIQTPSTSQTARSFAQRR